MEKSGAQGERQGRQRDWMGVQYHLYAKRGRVLENLIEEYQWQVEQHAVPVLVSHSYLDYWDLRHDATVPLAEFCPWVKGAQQVARSFLPPGHIPRYGHG